MENENTVTGEDIFTQGWDDAPAESAADGREAEPLPEADPPEADAETEESPAREGPEGHEKPESSPVPPADRDGEIRQFVRAYPGVMPEAIPQEVWRRVRAGESLLSAYDRYEASRLRQENRRLEAQLQSRRQEEANRQRSAGSQTGAGMGAGGHDPFDDGWDLEW